MQLDHEFLQRQTLPPICRRRFQGIARTLISSSPVVVVLVLASLLTFNQFAVAHSGGLDTSGCHTNRKTEDYHCHRAARAPAAGALESKVSSPDATPSGAVKKSRSGICHAPGTPYYAQTQRFTAYESVEACLASGGRLPKG
jgi:hypothetical protein